MKQRHCIELHYGSQRTPLSEQNPEPLHLELQGRSVILQGSMSALHALAKQLMGLAHMPLRPYNSKFHQHIVMTEDEQASTRELIISRLDSKDWQDLSSPITAQMLLPLEPYHCLALPGEVIHLQQKADTDFVCVVFQSGDMQLLESSSCTMVVRQKHPPSSSFDVTPQLVCMRADGEAFSFFDATQHLALIMSESESPRVVRMPPEMHLPVTGLRYIWSSDQLMVIDQTGFQWWTYALDSFGARFERISPLQVRKQHPHIVRAFDSIPAQQSDILLMDGMRGCLTYYRYDGLQPEVGWINWNTSEQLQLTVSTTVTQVVFVVGWCIQLTPTSIQVMKTNGQSRRVMSSPVATLFYAMTAFMGKDGSLRWVVAAQTYGEEEKRHLLFIYQLDPQWLSEVIEESP